MAEYGKIILTLVVAAGIVVLVNHIVSSKSFEIQPDIAKEAAASNPSVEPVVPADSSDDFKSGQKAAVSQGAYTNMQPQDDRKLNSFVYSGANVNHMVHDQQQKVSTIHNLALPREPISMH